MSEKQQRILIVDDSSTVRRVIYDELRDGGYELTEAKDGFEALMAATATPPPDLITLDVDMPKLDGFDTCRKLYDEQFIKQYPHLKGRIPVIFVTSNDSIKDRRKGYDLGAANFIAKPFAKGQILDAANKILRPEERLQGMTVLVVDDSSSARLLVRGILEAEGMTVIEAEDGIQGFEAACNNMDQIDLVITDLEMPRMEGDELCNKIRTELGLEDLPIIIFTGVADQFQLPEVFKAGATDYLTKPFIKEEMLARVTVQLDKARLNKHLRAMVTELSESNMIKDSMISICSHDLRSPLGGILGFADMLLEKDYLQNEDLESATHIKESGELMLALINDILDLSKFEASGEDLETKPISLSAAANKSINALKHLADNKKQRIEFIDNSSNSVISGDLNSILRAINNLLSNAVKFTPENGRIKLYLDSDPPGYLKLTVSDTGIGIPEDKIPNLFDRFTSASQTGTAGEKSTGLGMSIVKDIVEKHGGSIEVSSVESRGSSFQVVFPESKQPLSDSDEKKGIKDSGNITIDNQPRILLAEDNPVNQKLAKMMLNKQGCRVEVANNGEEAVKKYEFSPDNFDLIFMDIEMPEINGIEATEEIRKKGFDTIPIIAMTAHSMKGDRENYLEAGMNDYISKPIKKEVVLGVINKWLVNRNLTE